MLSDSYRNVLMTFSSCQDSCLIQNPDVHWIGTGALQAAQIWSPASHLGKSSALEDYLETPHGIGQAGTHCLDTNLIPYLLCFLYCCLVISYSLTRIFCHLALRSLECFCDFISDWFLPFYSPFPSPQQTLRMFVPLE